MVVAEGGGGMQVRMREVAVERGKTELKIFSFVRNGRTTAGGRIIGSRRTSGVGRTFGAWAISGTG